MNWKSFVVLTAMAVLWLDRGGVAQSTQPATVPATQPTTIPASAVPEVRLKELARGVNLQGWLWPGKTSFNETKNFHPVSDADLAMLHALGMTVVRLPVNPDALVDLDRPTELGPDALAALDRAIARILDHGLAVVVDFHASTKVETAIANSDKVAGEYVVFWKTLAEHLAKTDPDRVFFELINEPRAKDLRVQADEVAAIRSVDRVHTIVATGPDWSNPGEMRKIELVPDDDIVYTFHYYDPMTFTHQSATWAGDVFKPLKDVPYPSTPELIAPLLEQYPGKSQSRAFLKTYGDQHWDADVMERHMKPAFDWSAAHHVPIWLGEFGVYFPKSPPASRARWIHDVRTTAEKHGVGWCTWDFDGGFRLMKRHKDGSGTLDTDIATALGLDVAATQPATGP